MKELEKFRFSQSHTTVADTVS